MPDLSFNLLAYTKLNEEQKLEVVRAVRALHEQEYPPFEDENIDAESLIVAQLLKSETELGASSFAFSKVDFVGFYAGYPLGEQEQRQLSALKIQIDRVDSSESRRSLLNFYRQQRSINSIQPIMETSGYYLARFYVDPACREHGAGRSMIKRFFQEYGGEGPFWVHVNRKNDVAIAFYRRMGFVDSDSSSRYTFRLMKWG